MWTRDTKETAFMNLAAAFIYKQTPLHPPPLVIHCPRTWHMVNSTVYNDCTRLDPFTFYHFSSTSCNHQDISFANLLKKIKNNEQLCITLAVGKCRAASAAS